MPSVSKKQQNFFRLVKAYKNRKIKKKDVSQSIVDAANGMTKKQISHFADHRVKKYKVKKLDEMFCEITEKMKIIPISNDELDKISDKIDPVVLTDFDIDDIKNGDVIVSNTGVFERTWIYLSPKETKQRKNELLKTVCVCKEVIDRINKSIQIEVPIIISPSEEYGWFCRNDIHTWEKRNNVWHTYDDKMWFLKLIQFNGQTLKKNIREIFDEYKNFDEYID